MFSLRNPPSCLLANFVSEKCTSSRSNGSEECASAGLLVFLFKADCYFSPAFYLLTVILIVIGTVLNAFTTYCFWKMYKRDSQSIFLYILSISDTINLHVNFALPILRQWEKLDVLLRKCNPICRFVGVLTEFSLIFPAWILVLLTVDRLIYILRLVERPLSYTRRRAKMSLLILAASVFALSIYRLFDVKGIDQSSVFAIVACNGEDHSIVFMRNLNLMVWTLFPLGFTLILSLTMIYQIKTTTCKHKPNHPHPRPIKYDRATKTTLFVSILFPTFFHTPSGIMITLDLLYGHNTYEPIVIMIFVARKLTMILCEISSSCKFFVYIATYPLFKEILCSLFHRARRRRSSVELSQPAFPNSRDRTNRNTVRFGRQTKLLSFSESRTTSFSKSIDKHPNTFCQAENTSRTLPEHQSLIASITESLEQLNML